ncbi:MAG: hypothetical protein HZA17_14570, partial [Nitrospirae bacterium]|nr:hypothetical protein [Nitrospirota bacterium]
MSNDLLNEIAQWFGQGHGGRTLTQKYTAKIDSVLRDIFNEVVNGGSSGGSAKDDARKPDNRNLVLIATGGYGREELCPFSDIDIMFFAPDRSDTKAAEDMLYRLWDTGLDISHSFRTARECIEEAFRDIRTRTSLLEARY